jgi:uncharacterized membrane protein
MSIARETEDIAKSLIRHQHDHPPVRDLNRDADKRLSGGQRVADDLARLVGSWTFVIIQALLAMAWVGINVAAYSNHWDAYPFQLLNLVFSLEAAVWISLLLMAHNRVQERERVRAQNDYETAVKSEEELRAIMNHLEAQDEVMMQVLLRLDRTDREIRRLTQHLESEE